MADKYVDTSLSTGLNDGTSLANAWWSLIEVFKNTMASGSITAGDTINVRTHDGSANLGETATASITVAAPTSAAAATSFLFDNGTVWAQGAVFRYDATSSYYKITFTDYININAYSDGTRRFEYYTTYASTAQTLYMTFMAGEYNGIYLNAPLASSYNNIKTQNSVVTNLKLTMKGMRSGFYFMANGTDSRTVFINLVIEILDPLVDDACLFAFPVDGGPIEVIGGRVDVDQTSAEQYLFIVNTAASDSVNFRFLDFKLGVFAGAYRTTGTDLQRLSSSIILMGNGGAFDYYNASVGLVEHVQNNSAPYPYLNAILPDVDDTGWSYKIAPWGTSPGLPHTLPPIVKVFNQTAGVKTLTLEALVNTAFTGLTKNDLSATFFYIDDTTGLQKSISTVGSGPLAAGSTGWNNTSYGSKAYNPYKLEVTTPTAIKQGTKITAIIISHIPEVGLDDFWFIDPDITLS